MVLTTVDIPEELREKKLICGISYAKLIQIGLNSVENQKNSNQDLQRLEKNIANLQALLNGANRRIMQLEAQSGEVEDT